MRSRTLIGQEVTGLKREGYAIVYSGRIYTYGHYSWFFTRHNLSRGTSDLICWMMNRRQIKIFTETGDVLWEARVLASEADSIEYEVLS